jgi:acetate kinase
MIRNPTSPYYSTPVTDVHVTYLDTWVYRSIPETDDDTRYTIESKYQKRPDLLAYDLYGTSEFWWVFIVRNPNAFLDPIDDFNTGVTIFLPSKSTIEKTLS